MYTARSIGRSNRWTIKKCEARIEPIKAEILHGTSSLPAGRKTQLRFDELADWYIAEMEATNGKNLVVKRHQIQTRLKPHFNVQIIDGLSEDHIGRYTRARIVEGMSPATVNRDLATLSHILTTAVRRKRIVRVPCRVPKLDEPQGRDVPRRSNRRSARGCSSRPTPRLMAVRRVRLEYGYATYGNHISAVRSDRLDDASLVHSGCQGRDAPPAPDYGPASDPGEGERHSR